MLLLPLLFLCFDVLQSKKVALAEFHKQQAKLTNLKGATEFFDLSPRGSQYEAQLTKGGEVIERLSDEEKLQDEIEEGLSARGLKCVGWRAVEGCNPEGSKRDPSNDMGCGDWVVDGQAGWCECEYGFLARETGCRHEMFKCDDVCTHHTEKEGVLKQESADIAPTIKTELMVTEFEANGIVEYAAHNIGERISANLPFCIFLLCDCAEEIKWPVQEMVAHPAWGALKNGLLIGYARTAAATQWQLYVVGEGVAVGGVERGVVGGMQV
jgi:hypothetical protein